MTTDAALPARDTPDQPRSILIADDHPLYRDALETLVKRAPDLRLAGAVTNLPEALMALVSLPCDLVLLDLHMPGMDSVQSLRKVHRMQPNARIVLISWSQGASLFKPWTWVLNLRPSRFGHVLH